MQLMTRQGCGRAEQCLAVERRRTLSRAGTLPRSRGWRATTWTWGFVLLVASACRTPPATGFLGTPRLPGIRPVAFSWRQRPLDLLQYLRDVAFQTATCGVYGG
jgi:hypothetical protein